MFRCLLIAILISGVNQLGWSQPPEILEGLDPTDFYAIQERVNNFYKENPTADGYKQWKRKEYYLQSRLGPNGTIINTMLRNTKELAKYKKTHPDERATPHGAWIFNGPIAMNDPDPSDENGFGMGRLNCVRIHPILSGTIYVGSSSGGVWKSTNGGDTWANISPYLPSLSVKDIAIHPTSPNQIYILTGDGFNNSHRSIGILKSSDGGDTWHPTNAPAFDYSPHKLLMDPTDPSTQYAATSGRLYRTTDSWNSYDTLYDAGVFDIELKPDDPSTIYIATSTNIRKKVGAGNWTVLSDSDFSTWPSPRYIRIAVTPDQTECIYAFVAQSNGPVGLFRSMSAGANGTWTVQDTTLSGMGGQGPYNQSLEVKVNDYEDVTIGMVWTKISRNGGIPGSWVSPSNYVHADAHNSLFRNTYLYHCNDGGLFRSTPGDSIFDDLSSGLAITEIYGLAGTPMDLSLYYCGTQDNGTSRRTGSNTFDRVAGNDGGNCMIDYTDSDIVYATYQNGYLIKSTNGGASFTDINPPGTGDWVAPLSMDPVDPDIIFLGKDTLWRSDNGGSNWINLGKPTSNGGILKAIAQGTNNRERLYAANGRFADNKLYRLNNAISSPGSPSWTNITGDLVEGTIKGLCVNPDNANHVYVCLSNIYPDNKVFRSFSSGDQGTWENITGSLPNVPINCIEFHDNGENNNAIYLGTDIGVFYRDDDLGDWIYFSNLLPVVNVMDLYINTASNMIAAGTYGRGIWISATYSACASDLTLSTTPGNPLGGVRYYSASNKIESTVEYRSDLGTKVHYSGGNYLDLKDGFRVSGEGFFNGIIGPCPGDLIPSDLKGDSHEQAFDLETWLNHCARNE